MTTSAQAFLPVSDKFVELGHAAPAVNRLERAEVQSQAVGGIRPGWTCIQPRPPCGSHHSPPLPETDRVQIIPTEWPGSLVAFIPLISFLDLDFFSFAATYLPNQYGHEKEK